MSTISTSQSKKIESYIMDTMRKNKLPGLSICLIKDGEKVYSRGFGSACIQPPKPATPNTLYGVGSVTKTFTALSIMKLYEEGKLALQDPVKKYIPSFEADAEDQPVTIHQLLTHSSGFPDLGMAEDVIGRIFGSKTGWTPLGSLDDLVSHINQAKAERVSTKGDTFFYWNEGYAMLGGIIEKVSGKSYTRFVKETILSPLNMARSTFEREALEAEKDAMCGYVFDKEGGRRPQPFPAHPLVEAAGGLITSVTELANLVLLFLNRGEFSDHKIVSTKTLDTMLTPYIKHSLPPGLVGGEFYGYGLIINKNFGGYTLIGHGGNVGVSSAYFGFIPELNAGVTLASNADFSADTPALYALSVLCGLEPEKTLPQVAYDKKCELLKGTYESFKGARRMAIVEKGMNLFLEIYENGAVGLSLPLEIEGDDVYVIWGPEKTKLHVEQKIQGKVDIHLERVVYHKVS
ncbi:MAG: serine hydrolase [Thermoprotei archaeon]